MQDGLNELPTENNTIHRLKTLDLSVDPRSSLSFWHYFAVIDFVNKSNIELGI
jgi:hypothetical protein